MTGEAWEMFGAIRPSQDGHPTIRELDNSDGRCDWPDDEITAGVACVEISAHGDDPAGAFVKVTGPDRAAVAAMFERARDLVLRGDTHRLFDTTSNSRPADQPEETTK